MPRGTQSAQGTPRSRPPPIEVVSAYDIADSARSSTGATRGGAAHPVEALWITIEAHRNKSTPTYFENAEPAPNHTGVRCPNNADTLWVQLGQEKNQRAPLHANHVRLRKC